MVTSLAGLTVGDFVFCVSKALVPGPGLGTASSVHLPHTHTHTLQRSPVGTISATRGPYTPRGEGLSSHRLLAQRGLRVVCR